MPEYLNVQVELLEVHVLGGLVIFELEVSNHAEHQSRDKNPLNEVLDDRIRVESAEFDFTLHITVGDLVQ